MNTSGSFHRVGKSLLLTVKLALTLALPGQAFGQIDFVSSVPLGNVSWNDVAYADGIYVAVGGTQLDAPITAYSADGENWAFGGVVNGPGGSGILAVVHGDGTWVGVGWAGTVITSTDGMNWTLQNSGINAGDRALDVTYGRGSFILSGAGLSGSPDEERLVYRSRDAGVTWSPALNTPATAFLNSIKFIENTYLVVGDLDNIWALAIRPTWTQYNSGEPATSHMALTYGEGIYLSVGKNRDVTGVGEITTSVDGTNWTKLPVQGFDELEGAAFGNGVFVAVGRNGEAVVSEDGAVSWVSVDAATSESLSGITYGGSRFVAVGANGVITSADVEEPAVHFPLEAGTVRDMPVDGAADIIDSTNDGGFYGSVTNSANFVDVFVAEFDRTVIGDDFATVELVFERLGANGGALGADLVIASYVGDGSATLSDFQPAGLADAGTITLPSEFGSFDVLRLDMTDTVRGFADGILGVHFSLPSVGQTSVGSDYNGNYPVQTLVPRLVVTAIDNMPPTANAGPDQSVRAPISLSLSGSAFDDNTPAEDLLYFWSFNSMPVGSVASIFDPTVSNALVNFDIPGTYVLELLVTDADGATSAPDLVTISTENLAPTASAGSDQLVIVGSVVNLDGSLSSDPENDPLVYSWSLSAPAGSAATLLGAGTAAASFVPDVPGTYRATLSVDDLIGPGIPDSVDVVASTAADFAQIEIQSANDVLSALGTESVTSKGNQNALSKFLIQSTAAIQDAKIAIAADKLGKAMGRTDGCIVNGQPDGNGPGRDWVTDCGAQEAIYTPLNSARDAILQ